MYKTDVFSIIKCTHTPSSTPKIAKIYEKKILDLNPHIYDDIRQEICLLDHLKHSQFLLKMESTFETKIYVYIIYENAESIPFNFY